MKKVIIGLFISILFWGNFMVFGKTGDSDVFLQVEHQNKKIELINNELSGFKNNFLNFKEEYESVEQKMLEYYNKVVDSSNNIINNGLSNQGHILTNFTIIWVIIGVLLSIYISYIYAKIKFMQEASEKIHKNVETNLTKAEELVEVSSRASKLAKESVDVVENQVKAMRKIQEEIENEPDKIYQRILDAETKYIFRRLQKEPQDISNFFGQLTTREIPNDYSNMFVDFWNKIKDDKYIILSYQHMAANLFVSSNDYWDEFIKRINMVISSAFDNEIDSSSQEMLKEYLNQPLKYNERRKAYVTALINMNKLNLENDLHKTLSVAFDTPQQRDEFDRLIEEIKNPKPQV